MSGFGRIEDDEIVEGLDIWYLKCSGLWEIFNRYRDTGVKNKLFYVWMVLTVMFFSPLGFLSTCGPFFAETDLEGMTLIILNPMSCSQTVIKFAVLWYGIETQCKLLELFKNDFLSCVPPDKKARASQMLTASAKKANILAYLGMFMDAATVAVWNILPVLRSEYFRVQLGITAFGTPIRHNKILGFWYPVDYDETPYVQFVYCYEFFICAWAGFIIALLEGLVVQLVMLLTANIRVLQYLLEELKTSNSNLNSETLLLYVKEHQKLVEVGDDMRDLYNFLITMQLSTGLIILIITIFNFFLSSGNGDIIIMCKFIIYLMYTLVEVAVYCYVGSDLETTSEEIGFASYCSEWYKVGAKFRKTLQMMMVRSRYSMALKFGQLYPVNLMALTNTFMNKPGANWQPNNPCSFHPILMNFQILQMAYSTSMLLYRVTNKEEEEES